jgi:hypothetical protein
MADHDRQKPGGVALLALLLSILSLLLIGIGGLRDRALTARLEGVVTQRFAEASVKLDRRFEDLRRAHALDQLDRIRASLGALKAGLSPDDAARVAEIEKNVAALAAKIEGKTPAAPAD